MRSLDFSIDLILPAAVCPVHRSNFLYKWIRRIVLGIKGGWHVRLTISAPSVSRLSRQSLGASTSHNPMGLHSLLQDCFSSISKGFCVLLYSIQDWSDSRTGRGRKRSVRMWLGALYNLECWISHVRDTISDIVFEVSMYLSPKSGCIVRRKGPVIYLKFYLNNIGNSIIRIIKPRRMTWAGHVARMGEKRNVYSVLVGKS
jgi:hypothetical protein